MKKLLTVLTLALVLTPLAAHADSVSVSSMGTYYKTGGINTNASLLYPHVNGNFYIGQIAIKWNDRTYLGYCVDLFSDFHLGDSWTVTQRDLSDLPIVGENGPAFNPPYASANSGAHTRLGPQHLCPDGQNAGDDAAALQLALWLTIFPNLETSYFSFGSSSDAIRAQAWNWLDRRRQPHIERHLARCAEPDPQPGLRHSSGGSRAGLDGPGRKRHARPGWSPAAPARQEALAGADAGHRDTIRRVCRAEQHARGRFAPGGRHVPHPTHTRGAAAPAVDGSGCLRARLTWSHRRVPGRRSLPPDGAVRPPGDTGMVPDAVRPVRLLRRRTGFRPCCGGRGSGAVVGARGPPPRVLQARDRSHALARLQGVANPSVADAPPLAAVVRRSRGCRDGAVPPPPDAGVDRGSRRAPLRGGRRSRMASGVDRESQREHRGVLRAARDRRARPRAS